MDDDARWMGAALALAERGRGRTAPNPSVGCVIVKDGRVVGRGWTQPSGRPHAEAVALEQAGDAARGATAYVTLEPCSARSSAGARPCAEELVRARLARVVVAIQDPHHRIDGRGLAGLREAGIAVTVGPGGEAARRVTAGFLLRHTEGRPCVTLKLAMSIDGRIALASGQSKWITGPEARAHAHLERARADLIVVGRGTEEADAPSLDVRLEGLEDRSPRRAVMSRAGELNSPEGVDAMEAVNDVLVEGGAGVAAAFLKADRVDRLLIYRAPILIGEGLGIGDIGLGDLAEAHGRWRLIDTRMLGADRLEVYERLR